MFGETTYALYSDTYRTYLDWHHKSRRMTIFLRLLRYALYLALAGVLLGAIALGVTYWLIAPGLPSVEVLKDVRLQVPLRVKSADDKLVATFGETKRTPVSISAVPDQLKQIGRASCRERV